MTKVRKRGAITPSFVIMCGANFCDRGTTAWVPDIDAAALEFTSRGWAESAVGWVCPECAVRLLIEPSLLIPALKDLHRSQLTKLRLEYGANVAAAKINGNTEVLAGAMQQLKAVEDELINRNFDRAEFFTINS